VTRWVRAPGVLWRETFDRVLLLVPDSEEMIAGNLCAAAVWDALGEIDDADEIAALVEETFGIDAGDARRDVSEALEQLSSCGAVVSHER
jgi:hypothetical protein